MRYKKITVTLRPNDETASALAQAEMGERGFECFVDTPTGFEGYIQEEAYDETTMEGVEPQVEGVTMEWEEEDAPDEDWNAEWEKTSFTPIDIDGRMTIRGTEHTPNPAAELEVVIDPRLAFGTGHHETTRMMARWLLNHPLDGLTVMDMGCGTGVLAITAWKRGAKHVDAVDIDEWSVRNTETNAGLNGAQIMATQGDAKTLEGTREKYDLFIANINRNILMDGMPLYAQSIKHGGRLIISGFLAEDMAPLTAECARHGLTRTGEAADGDWRMMEFEKK